MGIEITYGWQEEDPEFGDMSSRPGSTSCMTLYKSPCLSGTWFPYLKIVSCTTLSLRFLLFNQCFESVNQIYSESGPVAQLFTYLLTSVHQTFGSELEPLQFESLTAHQGEVERLWTCIHKSHATLCCMRRDSGSQEMHPGLHSSFSKYR